MSIQLCWVACGSEGRWARGLLEEFWQQRFVCLSPSPRCKPHKYPSGRLANDLATPTLHSINISLKSIMSLLNEIKAKRFKSCFSLVSANTNITPDAVYFSSLLLPPFSLYLCVCVVLISLLHTRMHTHTHTHTHSNQPINSAMETKW